MFKNIDLFAGLKNEEMRSNRGNHVMTVVGRLRDGVDLERASAELRALAANLEREFPRTNEGWSVRLAPAFQGEHSIPGVMQLSGPIVLRFVAGSLDTSVETSPPTLH